VTLARLRWALNRLRLMSPAEVGMRAGRAVQAVAERAGIGLARVPPAAHRDGASGPLLLQAGDPGAASEHYRRRADAVLQGRIVLFDDDSFEIGFPPQWNRDPLTGITAPMSFGKQIDYRNERLVGNIKTLWEPSRHLQLVTLAQAWALTRDMRYAEGCRTLVESWIEQCPYPLGVHWSSSLELAIRLLNWAAAWDLLGGFDAPLFAGQDGQRFRDAWLASIYQHCHFIEGHLSRHSSANNHLLGEWMGLCIAALAWPCWPRSALWRARAQAGFEAEALLQNAPDGVNREQALYYHHEVADMMLLVGLAGRARGVPFSPEYWKRLEAMMDFVLAVMDTSGNVPMIGDADDALMLRLHHEHDWDPYRSLLASCAVLFRRGEFKSASRGFDSKSRWLLGEAGAREYDALPALPARPARRVFEEGGYTVLGSRFGTPDELRIVADAAPLGYLSIAAHGHADALAFTLSARGQELLIDPGTYAYHTEREWRDWFRGTAAHNTVCVDGENQSVIGGNFMWLQRARSSLEEASLTPRRDVWQASHDGYARLPDPVLHRRRIEVDHAGGRVCVDDTLQCAGRHVASIHWHVAETAHAALDGHGVVIEAPGVRLRMSMPGVAAAPTLLRGSTDPRGGWVSRRFGSKTPTTQVVWSFPLAGTTQWRTELQLEATQT
jgi:hypothetical protein